MAREVDGVTRIGKTGAIHSSTDEIAKALTGDYRAEHLFVLQQELPSQDCLKCRI